MECHETVARGYLGAVQARQGGVEQCIHAGVGERPVVSLTSVSYGAWRRHKRRTQRPFFRYVSCVAWLCRCLLRVMSTHHPTCPKLRDMVCGALRDRGEALSFQKDGGPERVKLFNTATVKHDLRGCEARVYGSRRFDVC